MGVCLGGDLASRAALNEGVGACGCFDPPTCAPARWASFGPVEEGDGTLAQLAELRAQAGFERQDPHGTVGEREAIRARQEEVGARYEWQEVKTARAFLRDEGPQYDPTLFMQAGGSVEIPAIFCLHCNESGRESH